MFFRAGSNVECQQWRFSGITRLSVTSMTSNLIAGSSTASGVSRHSWRLRYWLCFWPLKTMLPHRIVDKSPKLSRVARHVLSRWPQEVISAPKPQPSCGDCSPLDRPQMVTQNHLVYIITLPAQAMSVRCAEAVTDNSPTAMLLQRLGQPSLDPNMMVRWLTWIRLQFSTSLSRCLFSWDTCPRSPYLGKVELVYFLWTVDPSAGIAIPLPDATVAVSFLSYFGLQTTGTQFLQEIASRKSASHYQSIDFKD